MTNKEQDYYKLLGIKKTATTEEIKKAYKNKAKTCHPDLHPDNPNAILEFKALNKAHKTLTDDKKRWQYDNFGPIEGNFNRAKEDPTSEDFGPVFDEFFG